LFKGIISATLWLPVISDLDISVMYWRTPRYLSIKFYWVLLP
jgi:hypothetical protein